MIFFLLAIVLGIISCSTTTNSNTTTTTTTTTNTAATSNAADAKNLYFFLLQQQTPFIPTEGALHPFTPTELVNSFGEDFSIFKGLSALPYCLSLKLSNQCQLLHDNKLFKTCVDAVNNMKSEASFPDDDRYELLRSLRQIGLFSTPKKGAARIDEAPLRAALNNFYGRKVLGLIASLLRAKEIKWLMEFDLEYLITNHEVLDGLKDFSIFTTEIVIKVNEFYYDLTANEMAMKTLSAASLSAFLQANKYLLRPAQLHLLKGAKNFSKMLADLAAVPREFGFV